MTGYRMRLSGVPGPKLEPPIFLSSFDLYWDSRHSQDTQHFCFLQSRSIVFHGNPVQLFVYVKSADSVGVGNRAQGAELFGAQQGLQIVGYFDESHANIIAGALTPEDRRTSGDESESH